ncbi:MAG: hypothetical protein JKY49_18290 [Cohaesibacteraceae bacterium]|nr:hypothetical protein [Cohaesibacteraceae bacterium]
MSEFQFRRVKNPDTGETISTENLIAGAVKAWANLQGNGTIAIRDSFNISSVVDGGNGFYTFNVTSAMLNNLYSHFSGLGDDAAYQWTLFGRDKQAGSIKLNTQRSYTGGVNTNEDVVHLSLCFMGRLA